MQTLTWNRLLQRSDEVLLIRGPPPRGPPPQHRTPATMCNLKALPKYNDRIKFGTRVELRRPSPLQRQPASMHSWHMAPAAMPVSSQRLTAKNVPAIYLQLAVFVLKLSRSGDHSMEFGGRRMCDFFFFVFFLQVLCSIFWSRTR